VNSQYSLQAFNEYILYERRAKHPDLFVTRGVYERAIAEAAKQRFNGLASVEDILRIFGQDIAILWYTLFCPVIYILRTRFLAVIECRP
jgi:hypothetical protein